ncbi:MAG: hypothetical protein R3320_08415, partial [Nitriliruptorales bacterium]|nr:hypothetical protein [Nitriliruptorales bacterium]
EVTGTDGVLWVMQGHGRMLDVPPVVLRRGAETRTFADMPTAWATSFEASAHHLVDALDRGDPPVLTGAQGREVLAFALAAQRSATEHTPVRLDAEINGEGAG